RRAASVWGHQAPRPRRSPREAAAAAGSATTARSRRTRASGPASARWRGRTSGARRCRRTRSGERRGSGRAPRGGTRPSTGSSGRASLN
ncbi:hypothetical protein CH063_07867, partial [Colletotrichum higginsianum]